MWILGSPKGWQLLRLTEASSQVERMWGFLRAPLNPGELSPQQSLRTVGVGTFRQCSLGSNQRMCVWLTVCVSFEFLLPLPQSHKILPHSRHLQGKEMGCAAGRSKELL